MTDPVVARKTFTEAMGHEPSGEELARLMAAYLSVLPDYVTASEGYRVLPGVSELLPRLHDAGVLLGVTTGALEAGAHAKLGRARAATTSSSSVATAPIPRTASSSPTPRSSAASAGWESRSTRARWRSWGIPPWTSPPPRAPASSSVGVATGKYDLDELRAAKPDHALADLTEPFPEVAG